MPGVTAEVGSEEAESTSRVPLGGAGGKHQAETPVHVVRAVLAAKAGDALPRDAVRVRAGEGEEARGEFEEVREALGGSSGLREAGGSGRVYAARPCEDAVGGWR
jgi:hypothetical protein